MNRKPILIDIAPERLIVSVPAKGAAPTRHRCELDPAEWEHTWAESLRSLDLPLRNAVAALNVAGAPAYVLCRTPGAAADVVGVPTAGRAAELAARLALVDSASLNAMLDPIDAFPLGADIATDSPQTHVLACGMRAAEARMLCALLDRANVQPVAIMPADAPAMARAVADALTAHDGCQARLHLDEHSTVLAASENGKLIFVRTIDVGIEAIVESLARAFPADDRAASCAKARETLERVGIPSPNVIADVERGLTGEDLLPLIQPVLQRLIIETKQSFRFALDDAQRESLQVFLSGAGAGLARLDALIGEQLDQKVTCDGHSRSLATLTPADLPDICLMPQERMMRRLTQRVGRSFAAGVFIACALLSGEAMLTHADASSVEQQFKSLRPTLKDAELTEEQRQHDRQIAQAMVAVERNIDDNVAGPVRWRQSLAALIALAPEGVAIATVDAAQRREGMTLVLRGAATSASEVTIYAEALVSISHNLLANCEPAKIKRIYSKPEVFMQCRRWLSTQYPGAELIPASSTSRAVMRAKEEQEAEPESGTAAIASTLAGTLYGVSLQFEDIEDNPNNVTRFLVLARQEAERSGADKTSVMFATEDKPGALSRVLTAFDIAGVNLTHIEKRPSGRENWRYTFFIDAEGHKTDARMQRAIEDARAHCQTLTVLGSYPRASRIL